MDNYGNNCMQYFNRDRINRLEHDFFPREEFEIEDYKKLQIENKRLKKALQLTIDRWRLIGRKVWDTKLKVSILEIARQLEKDVEQVLNEG